MAIMMPLKVARVLLRIFSLGSFTVAGILLVDPSCGLVVSPIVMTPPGYLPDLLKSGAPLASGHVCLHSGKALQPQNMPFLPLRRRNSWPQKLQRNDFAGTPLS